jgi:uncharacterized protein (UPF0332 family)
MKGEMTEEMIDALAMYRLQRAKSQYKKLIDMLEKEHYNAAINAIIMLLLCRSALLVKNGIQVHTHSGTKRCLGCILLSTQTSP